MVDVISGGDGLERERLSLGRDKVRLERQRLATETRLKRRELAKGGKSWKELLANPLSIAIASGFLSVMGTLITTAYTSNQNRQSEEERARQARASEDLRAKYASDSAKQALQAELIKKFVEAPRTETVRGNLRFLVDVGLLPDYGARIEKYLKENTGAPTLGNTVFTEIGFEVQAPYLLGRLMNDFSLQDFQAAGIVGNIAEETKGFSFRREILAASASGPAGGRGYFSWTGSRRQGFERFTQEKGLDPDTVEANYAFLKHELERTENAAVTALKKTVTLEDATRQFMNRVLRPHPAVANIPSRINFAERALSLYKAQFPRGP